MIDYHTHIAVLDYLRANVAASMSGDPALTARVGNLLAAVAAEPDAAALGACIDQVVSHAASDGTELQILQAASDLCSQGHLLFEQFGKCRNDIDTALQNPTSPASLPVFQNAMALLAGMTASLRQLQADTQNLQAVIAPLPHVREHPRQADVAPGKWDFGNVFAGRRTDAYVRATFEAAQTEREVAFAFGVLSSYAGNVAGSAYLGQVVGGPRRAHRYRDRLARNTVGAWMHAHAGTPALSTLGSRVAFGGPSTGHLPMDLAKLCESAFATAYPRRTPPDLDLGLRRMAQHLRLLDTFVRPPLPEPPPLTPAAAGADTGTLSTLSNDYNVPGYSVPLDPDMTPSDPGTSDTHGSGATLCLMGLIIALTVGLALLIYCIGMWSTGKKCVVSDFFDALQGSEAPDPTAPTGTTQAQLVAMSDPEIAAHIAQELYNYQMLIWQIFDLSYDYLAVTGLIYPDDLIMSSPLYAQFVSTPARSSWPHRSQANQSEGYEFDPSSPIEQPATAPPFPAGAPPSAILSAWGDQQHACLPLVHSLLGQILRHNLDSQNYDQDADRGFAHPCWDVAQGTSINAPAISVHVLDYAADQP